MSKQQQLQLDAILRQGQFDGGGDVQTLRTAFGELMAQVPVAPDIQQNPVEIGGVAGVEVTIEGNEAENVILYFHGGVYVIGSAAFSVPLVGDLVRRTGTKAITLEYRLAPEHPYPAAVEDARAAYEGLLAQGIAPAQIALAGESAGGGLAVATLLALREAGVPLPSCGYLMSPYVDLTLSGETLAEKREVDPLLTPDGLRARVPDYVAGPTPLTPISARSSAISGNCLRFSSRLVPTRSSSATRSGSPDGQPSPMSRSRSMSPQASRTSSRRMRASSMRQERRSTGHQTF